MGKKTWQPCRWHSQKKFTRNLFCQYWSWCGWRHNRTISGRWGGLETLCTTHAMPANVKQLPSQDINDCPSPLSPPRPPKKNWVRNYTVITLKKTTLNGMTWKVCDKTKEVKENGSLNFRCCLSLILFSFSKTRRHDNKSTKFRFIAFTSDHNFQLKDKATSIVIF